MIIFFNKHLKIKTLIFIFYLLPTYAQADEIKVVTEYLSPYQIKNKDGSLGGFSTDVVNALFKEANKKPKIIVMPWARAFEVAKSEKNVMIFSIARTKERNNQFHWLGSLTKDKLYFWGLKDNFLKPINNIEYLKEYKVATSRNSNVDKYLTNLKFNNIYRLFKENQNILMLYNHRADLIVSTESTLKNKSKILGIDFNQAVKVSEIIDLSNDLNIAINLHSDPELILKFQQAYSEIKSQGIIEALKQKWQIYN